MENIDQLAALDRYAAYTDLTELKKYSALPLRKCVRVNTLKSSMKSFTDWAKSKHWQLEPVPWCKEGFFVDRENRDQPLGKDYLHVFGHMYMQEASSMLPVELLDPKPGDKVLDMAAAPGSKTTQIAAKLQGRGILVANDMQEKRLWTLKAAVHRAGALNVIITKKMGQWFGKHMTERFDRVLCDAPCTAQGTIRKDPTALQYSSELGIMKAAKLQREMLEAAVHACKVGGRIVYSTCTLAPEENEEILAYILQKFPDQLQCVHPKDCSIEQEETLFSSSIEDSNIIQKTSQKIPLVRLWPHTFNSEGFFCAVLQKTGSTLPVTHMDVRHWREQKLKKDAAVALSSFIHTRYGTQFLQKDETLYSLDKELFLLTEGVAHFFLPTVPFSIGIPFGKITKKPPIILHHDTATLRGAVATKNIYSVTEKDMIDLLEGKNITCDAALDDHVLLQYKHLCVGLGRAHNGTLKNHIPRTIVHN